MKLLSLNVALFEKNNEKLSRFLDKHATDILCLQEITRRLDLSVNPDFVTYDLVKEDLPNLPYSFFGPIWQLDSFTAPNFHGAEQFIFKLGGMVEFGNYIQTKYPIFFAENRFIQRSFSLVTDWNKTWGNEPRGILVADLQIGMKQLRVINYHGIWSKDKQGTERTINASKAIIELIQAVEFPSIVCGDFNLFPDTKSIQLLNTQMTNLCDSYSIKTTRPMTNELSNKARNVVDYIFASSKIQVNSFEVVDSDVSDHLPLILDFDFSD